jgi:hypothetical protein
VQELRAELERRAAASADAARELAAARATIADSADAEDVAKVCRSSGTC